MAMPSSSCRLCGALLPGEPAFSLENVPRSAQGLPGVADLAGDSGADLRVFQCHACGLVQLAGAPVPYFQEVITAAGGSARMVAFRREQARQFVAGFDLHRRRILEVGCGEGYFLDLLDEAGAESMGLEAGAFAVARGRALGRTIHQGYLEAETRLVEGPFEAFASINFLEHAPNPVGLLRGLCRNLVPGAPGLVEVPSFEHMLECDRFYDFIPDHLSYFTESTLRQLLERSGFDVISCSRVWDGYDLAALVRRRRPFEARTWDQARGQLVAALKAFCRTHGTGGRGLAVWGASHQALTLLALADAAAVRYVVDSAPFKQGRFTPVVHTPIRGPEALAEDPVDAVIVMAAGYSGEVVRILREERAFRGTVAVLRGNTLEVVP